MAGLDAQLDVAQDDFLVVAEGDVVKVNFGVLGAEGDGVGRIGHAVGEGEKLEEAGGGGAGAGGDRFGRGWWP